MESMEKEKTGKRAHYLSTPYRCVVKDCGLCSRGKVLAPDQFGPAGHRCLKHGGGKRCSVVGCEKANQGKVLEADEFGAPGERCILHRGGRRCSIPGCVNLMRGSIKVTD